MRGLYMQCCSWKNTSSSSESGGFALLFFLERFGFTPLARLGAISEEATILLQEASSYFSVGGSSSNDPIIRISKGSLQGYCSFDAAN